MSNSSFPAGRWIAAVLAALALAAVFYNLVIDNMPKGDVRNVPHYTPWDAETIRLAETLPIQDGGRIKPLSTYAGFAMLSLHGARSMKIAGESGKTLKIKPTEWMLDALFRPQIAADQPTFRVDNSSALEAIGVKTRGKRDRYSYSDIQSGRNKLGVLAQSYQMIDAKQRDPVQTQVLDLAANLQTYESLLGYFSFARSGVVLRGSAENSANDKRADISALMTTAPMIREQINQSQAKSATIEPRLRDLLDQVLEASNFAKSGLFMLPPPDAKELTWQSAGNAIMDVMSGASKDSLTAVDDIKALETAARAADESEASFRVALGALRDRLVKRAITRGESQSVELEATYYRKNWFLYALIFFLTGTIAAFGMWTTGATLAGRIFAWLTLGSTLAGLAYCVTAIVLRCIIMQRPPVGNLYDTVIFIATAVVILSLIVEWVTRRRFALGIGPILGTALIVLARRFELGDAKDHMDPLVAVLDSNFWLSTHVITITLGYTAGLLSAFLSVGYLLMRGLKLDNEDKDLRRAVTRAVYGMLCFTLFLSLVGTVLGGIWANYSWGRFWGWDPKENGALLIVLWTLAILHARLGGYLREWGIHFASVFTAIVVTFSWWHVNFLGVGLHNYGFTAGKNTILVFYVAMMLVLIFGFTVMILEKESAKKKESQLDS
ncbi:MAG: cytochrome c biogenesis protein CcsA [Gloeobacteraceae cyanobacterium ES-bin-144]|nr:cytochrome c biogenesis protein CcsA [Verrucomicrobiales bacterium]